MSIKIENEIYIKHQVNKQFGNLILIAFCEPNRDKFD